MQNKYNKILYKSTKIQLKIHNKSKKVQIIMQNKIQ